MPELTREQSAAVGCGGKCIVSASAGSGKTFVMIQKICNFVEEGGDLESILAITYTTKAAAQMKEKLRSALIDRLKNCGDEDRRAHIKAQLNKVAYADVSTVHSFCSRLIRTYFYVADVDASFDIVGGDDSGAQELKNRAADDLFEKLYESDDADFLHLLSCYRKKRSDAALKKLVLSGYDEARNVPDYREKLKDCASLFCEQGFNEVCSGIHAFAEQTLRALLNSVKAFEEDFLITNPKTAPRYAEIFAEMRANLNAVIDEDDIFEPLPPLYSGSKPRDNDADKAEGERFSKFKDGVAKRYKAIYGDIEDRQTEYDRFISSGRTAVAFCNVLLAFDEQYSAAKREDGKLDYSDLEHVALQILARGDVKDALHERYKRVYVDEFQDVNPVQERIIDALCGEEAFFVGDVKQAIYGFRGCKSRFFSDKFNAFSRGEGSALMLSSNFRSGDGVINFVNELFSDAMNEDICGFSYRQTGMMRRGGLYPEGCGNAEIDLFSEGEEQKIAPRGIYSVKDNCTRTMPHSPLGLAVLEVVRRELGGEIFDLKTGATRPAEAGDICILTRKRSNEDAVEIARALKDAGYSVAGAKEDNICLNPEVKQLLDVLSYIDNAEQDVPLCAAMLSPAGGFCEDELARVRVAFRTEKGLAFRDCARQYAERFSDDTAQKLRAFYEKFDSYRSYAEIAGAGALIDRLCEDAGWEAAYSAGGGEKIKNIRRVQALAYSGGDSCSLSALLKKLKDSGYSLSAPESADSDSIKIMTMHSSKGLEFPIVILADICTSFKGASFEELPFDDDYGFTPRWYDEKSMTCGTTVLRRLCKLRSDREEIKNELNLFYVACTRAMCNLHVMASDLPEYNAADALFARCYAQFADFSKFNIVNIDCPQDMPRLTAQTSVLGDPDGELLAALEEQFARGYNYADSVDLPVKSSASQIMKLHLDEDGAAVHRLFSEDEAPAAATGAERGTAYHRFLQLCDFSKKSEGEIAKQLEEFCRSGAITKEQRALLEVENLVKILNMSVFDGLSGAEIFREREFLCRLKACDIMPVKSEEFVLVQGAIDLLATEGNAARIIDYKYSVKDDAALVKTYSSQLALYKKAVSTILHIPEERITTAIVNIYRLSEINL